MFVIKFGLLSFLCLLSCLFLLKHFTVIYKNSNVIQLGYQYDDLPRIVHYVFGMQSDYGGKPFSLVHYLAIKSAQVNLKPLMIYIHFVHEPNGHWWDELLNEFQNIQLNQMEPIEFIFDHPVYHPAHQSDIARLLILIQYGGIYLDTDVFILHPFPNHWYQFNCLIAQEGENASIGLGNAIILAKPQSMFLKNWYQEYQQFNPYEWATLSIKKPKELWLKDPELVHVLNSKRFYYPLWNELDVVYRNNSLNLYEIQGQYAYHAWSHLAWEPFLKNLTIRDIQQQDTTFKRLVWPFVRNSL